MDALKDTTTLLPSGLKAADCNSGAGGSTYGESVGLYVGKQTGANVGWGIGSDAIDGAEIVPGVSGACETGLAALIGNGDAEEGWIVDIARYEGSSSAGCGGFDV